MHNFKPKLPYYAVIFTSSSTENQDGYQEMANLMETLVKQQDGFLGMDSAKQNVGITVSYWKSLEAIKNWKAHSEHLLAQIKGREKWYSNYNVRVCKVEREYNFDKY